MTLELAGAQNTSSEASALRPCPFCTVSMPEAVSLCGACGRFSKPMIAVPAAQEKLSIIERTNIEIARSEADPQFQQRLKWLRSHGDFSLPQWLRLGFGAVLLLLSAAMGSIWLRFGGWGPARDAFALFVSGSALLLGNRVLRCAGEPVVQPTNRPPNDASIRLLGYDINIALVQGLALAAMTVFALRSEIDSAWSLALATILLAPLLWQTSYKAFALFAGATGLLYIAYIWIVGDLSYLLNARNNALTSDMTFDPIEPYLWTVAAVALIPQLQLPKVAQVGIGRFKGDTSFWLFGSDVSVAAGSSLVLVSAALAIEPLLFAPWWIPSAVLGL